MNLVLCEAKTLPSEVKVNEIAEEALQAAFGVIADRLGNLGYPVSGDFFPGEVFQMDDAFRMFVRAMALNNGRIHEMQEDN